MIKKHVFIFLAVLLIANYFNAQELTYPREGTKKSEFYDGPYILNYKDSTKIINSVEANGHMVLRTEDYLSSELNSVEVYKSGFMPRKFKVNLQKDFGVTQSIYPKANKIFMISDIEGNFNTFANLLQQHGVLDGNLNWNFGDGHLVVIGDVFDRGNHQTELLWLIYKLEQEAKAEGGNVHLVLGNHEIMNLQGDLRYLENKYTVLDSLVTSHLDIGYEDLYGRNTELGKWLRSKNTVMKIGDLLFVHGGISPKIVEAELTIDDINGIARSCIDRERSIYSKMDSLIMKSHGPFWYRGLASKKAKYNPASSEDVEKILNHFEAKTIFVGHTGREKPESLYDGRVRAINVYPFKDHFITYPTMHCNGVLMINNEYWIVDENGYLEKF